MSSIDRITIFFLIDLVNKLRWCRYAMSSAADQLSILVNTKEDLLMELGILCTSKQTVKELEALARVITNIENELKKLIK